MAREEPKQVRYQAKRSFTGREETGALTGDQREEVCNQRRVSRSGLKSTDGTTLKKKERNRLSLKKGSDADVLLALSQLDHLGAMLRVRPERFLTLLALAQGRPEEAKQEHITHLTKSGFISKDGSISQDLRELLLSAYQMTGDGPVLVNPFKLQTNEDKRKADRADRQIDRFWEKFLSGPNKGGRSDR